MTDAFVAIGQGGGGRGGSGDCVESDGEFTYGKWLTGLDGDGPGDLATIDEGAEFPADILEYAAIGRDGELGVLAGDFRAIESDGARGIAADLEFARDEIIRDQQLIALVGHQFDNGS